MSPEDQAHFDRFNRHAAAADLLIQKRKRTISEALELQFHQKGYREAALALGGLRLAVDNG